VNYEPQKPIAVFLGPSLERIQASQILAANYYPPARMGDIYRLLGSGVRIIVLIDGVFHQEASVWQRELLEALDNDIMVIGASSMGALRAAELHSFGMIGHGTIFEWYRDGFIDGDDEVALNHADESNGFRPFSEPLVNIRYNLMEAVRQGCISQQQGAELIEYAKRTYYADRAYNQLFHSEVVKKWAQGLRTQLTQFINQNAVNLKKQDAIGALRYCASVAKMQSHRATSSSFLMEQSPYYRWVSYHKRGFLRSDGCLVSGEELLAEAYKNANLINTLRSVLVKNYFLLLWAKQKDIRCPEHYLESYRQEWKNDHIKSDYSQWFRSNGLTERECKSELADRALLDWIVEQGANHFGLDFKHYVQFVDAFLSLNHPHENDEKIPMQEKPKAGNSGGRAGLLRQASELCYLVAWAKEKGIACPSTETQAFIKEWEENQGIRHQENLLNAINLGENTYLSLLKDMALVNWLIKKEPTFFGYISWSFKIALIKELQITGRAADIIKKIQHDITHTCLYSRDTPSDSS